MPDLPRQPWYLMRCRTCGCGFWQRARPDAHGPAWCEICGVHAARFAGGMRTATMIPPEPPDQERRAASR